MKKKNYKHKYLNAIGLKSNNPCIFNTTEWDTAGRNKKFKKQRQKHGFDVRETWSLDYTLLTWLYEHIKYFYKITRKIIDRTESRLMIPVLVKSKTSEGSILQTQIQEVSEDEVFKILIKYIKKALIKKDPFKAREYASAAYKILADMHQELWW